MPAKGIYHIETVFAALALVGWALAWLVARLGRSRPDLSIARAVMTGVVLRVLAAVAVSLTSVASALRGGDEIGFLADARTLSKMPLDSADSLHALTSNLHAWVLSLELRLADFTEMSLRIVQVGIAVAGIVLLTAAIHDLAGARAAKVACWCLMLEPSNLFFTGLLHKESLMLLGAGLVAFGGAKVWTHRDLSAVTALAGGGLVAVATRPYAGWFLVAAAGAICLHGSLRAGGHQSRSLVLAATVLLLGAAAAPKALETTSHRKLQGLQSSQSANASDASNLKLERVDYSTRATVVENLPRRMRDVLFRPYPWQLNDTSQRLGLIGTAVALIALVLLARAAIASAGQVLARAGPLIYPALFLLIAYSLSAGNAGTSFRYRTHLVALGICLIVVLRRRPAESVSERRARHEGATQGTPNWAGAMTKGRRAVFSVLAGVLRLEEISAISG